MECQSCNRRIRAYLSRYKRYCYDCGTTLDMKDKEDSLREALGRLELDKAIVASWRAHV